MLFFFKWLDWHHSANVLLAGTGDGNVWMWKIPSGDTKTFQGHGCRSTCGMFMKDGKLQEILCDIDLIQILDNV